MFPHDYAIAIKLNGATGYYRYKDNRRAVYGSQRIATAVAHNIALRGVVDFAAVVRLNSTGKLVKASPVFAAPVAAVPRLVLDALGVV